MNNKFIKILALVLIIIFVCWLYFFIGIDFSINTLILVMCIDYILGIALAIIGHSKHGNGKISSDIGYRGIIKKITVLLLVSLGAIIDDYLVINGIGFEYIKDISIVAFIINETISIIENSRYIGIEIPSIFEKIINILLNIKSKKINKRYFVSYFIFLINHKKYLIALN